MPDADEPRDPEGEPAPADLDPLLRALGAEVDEAENQTWVPVLHDYPRVLAECQEAL